MPHVSTTHVMDVPLDQCVLLGLLLLDLLLLASCVANLSGYYVRMHRFKSSDWLLCTEVPEAGGTALGNGLIVCSHQFYLRYYLFSQRLWS